MGLEPNLNRTKQTKNLVSERTEQNPNPYFSNQTRTEPNRTLIAIEPEQNRTQIIRVLSHSTPHHTNGQRNATLVNTQIEMGLEPNPNQTNQTRTLVF